MTYRLLFNVIFAIDSALHKLELNLNQRCPGQR